MYGIILLISEMHWMILWSSGLSAGPQVWQSNKTHRTMISSRSQATSFPRMFPRILSSCRLADLDRKRARGACWIEWGGRAERSARDCRKAECRAGSQVDYAGCHHQLHRRQAVQDAEAASRDPWSRIAHAYRQRFGLPSDYPMVAPNYAAQRSALAKSIGLGRPGGRIKAEEKGARAAKWPDAQAFKLYLT